MCKTSDGIFSCTNFIPSVSMGDKLSYFEDFNWWADLKNTTMKLVLKICVFLTFYYENIQTEKLKE